MPEPTVYNDKLGQQEFREENGWLREIITRRDVTDWWDTSSDGAPVPLGEAAKRLYYAEDLPQPGDELKDKGGLPIMNNRSLYLIARTFRLRDANQAQVELRYEYLGSKYDDWVDIDGSLHQLQTSFDNQKPTPQPIVLARPGYRPVGVEVTVLDPRQRASKTYPVWLQPTNGAISAYIDKLMGKVNQGSYLGKPAGSWLVTNVTATTKVEGNSSTGRNSLVQIRVEIEHDPRGHKQFAYWRDPLTGFTDPDLVWGVEGETYKRVDWHEEIDFAVEFDA